MSRSLGELSDKVSEVAAVLTSRNGIAADSDWLMLKLQEELGELTAEHLRLSGRKKREGLDENAIIAARNDEAADLLAILLLYARHHDIDLEAAVERKWLKHLRPVTKTG
ncbi:MULTISPECIES: hypothetical protein [Devosia]|uniref:Phosphoribosyl-ATP pyrophosphohydrolase n=1 Tax=Devosia equisanguinis TaxID=2490941 RepID=A0A3S4D6V5_9HYPH|nr:MULTISPECIES: hypothetical protein [Devosia]ODT50653.1 MAG: hypothetical protein ABS74_03865 [Pelagibacterium sp. SCN 63-126]ODU85253.1 MAG: hypothetical protein ABT14_13485 [Pelagibacterium sp. SCN 63-17]OJX45400.1 MAG: hypothetical protein BGO80_06185 [Devosia sp. 63-57]VDS05798.1 hypothetical protein DEVEQU_02943 [Devosia equisanguinis]